MTDKANSVTDEALTLAATELIAELLADAKKAWAKEVEVMAAESRAVIAELKAAALEHRVAELESKKAKR